ncbi:hypothetical protein SAMN02745181_3433 [Rubritalea squalenifaciens DSM 18772]|uniref:Uncharacterized protein n=1 Tax=Rubritalea squalenifaciens DSM 18772 TaxID=1123071 RepID=A0A1M6QLL7_9BACT|nr:hypothetical protein [Rubritalea squalenifaciens]SHK20953.1 hypothetical protein SAMN02745181_3433 [Rubritalea squalenifaciens DSM 18772]
MLISFLGAAVEAVLDVVVFWSDSEADKRRVKEVSRARNRVLQGSDDVLVDSNRNYLLLCTDQGLYLVSRDERWKKRLSHEEERMYEKRGKKAFRAIRKRG